MLKREIESVIERIQQMEQCYDKVLMALESKPNELYENDGIEKIVQELIEYMDSGLWLCDYQRDESGELPKDLKRGVLSEDGLYNLLCKIKEEK